MPRFRQASNHHSHESIVKLAQRDQGSIRIGELLDMAGLRDCKKTRLKEESAARLGRVARRAVGRRRRRALASSAPAGRCPRVPRGGRSVDDPAALCYAARRIAATLVRLVHNDVRGRAIARMRPGAYSARSLGVGPVEPYRNVFVAVGGEVQNGAAHNNLQRSLL